MKLIQTRTKYKIYDAVQKAWVNVCMGATVLSMSFLAYKFYYYVRYIKPLEKIREEKLRDELLMEGRMLSEQLKEEKIKKENLDK